jgi:hypothetical protein
MDKVFKAASTPPFINNKYLVSGIPHPIMPKGRITEQLVVQSLSSIYGVGP